MYYTARIGATCCSVAASSRESETPRWSLLRVVSFSRGDVERLVRPVATRIAECQEVLKSCHIFLEPARMGH
jgi:hypothetical protein